MTNPLITDHQLDLSDRPIPMIETWQDTHGLSDMSGLSRMIKRYAYTIPDDQVSRWMLLIVSDRVDAMESQIAEAIKSPWFLLGITLSAGAAIYLSKERFSKTQSQENVVQ